jgi:NhaP-type Na+/H+ or K+/H+ antiporter
MPVSTSMLYLLAGLAAGPLGFAMAAPTLPAHATLLEHLTEVIVLLSLFTSGMKMSLGWHDRSWFPSLRLALASIVVHGVSVTPLMARYGRSRRTREPRE